MTPCYVCLKLNFHRYTNLLEMGITGLIQELLETCIYCLCVIGTICWHEVITCEHHVSIDQKYFHLNSLTFLGQQLYGWVQYFGFYICVLLPWSYLLVFLLVPSCFYNTVLCWWTVGWSGKLLLCLGLLRIFLICNMYINCKMPSQIQSAHTQFYVCTAYIYTTHCWDFFCILNKTQVYTQHKEYIPL